ncbi:MAG: YaiI/YqxD family protein [Desulfobacteraceae bacterium]|nr:YaiI/YqxD family protein [Desulfobacteraceae bacterium]MBC2757243.1 YaiI/YqxD family protein [Desulfobacteraceae bacterium]
MLKIYIDADACPVKNEVFRVAQRYELDVILVSNTWMNTPKSSRIQLQVVDGNFDAADDWIVDHAETDDIVISADIPLASRCLEKGAWVLGPKGRAFTKDNIGDIMATREIMSHLRDLGTMTGVPAPFQRKDRSRFLQSLDRMIQSIKRR